MTGFYDDTDKPLDIHNDRKFLHLLVNYQMLKDGPIIRLFHSQILSTDYISLYYSVLQECQDLQLNLNRWTIVASKEILQRTTPYYLTQVHL